jgi:2-(1,2-epoxy-1,2-dihydrophenyl)acetyl-CoA isomerase
MSVPLMVEVRESVCTITMNRPERLNALDIPAVDALREAIRTAGGEKRVKALVLTGAGRAFCAGGDVKAMREALADDPGAHMKRLTEAFHGVMSALARCPKPVLAAVSGIAAGGGLSLMLACDIALASADATFHMAYLRLGGSPDGGSTYFLPRLVGLRKALEVTLLGDPLSAEEAHRLGLVNAVAPAAGFPAAVAAWGARLAAGPAAAMAAAKALMRSGLHESLETQMETESQIFARIARTADFAEGVTAFTEKRPPRFAPEGQAG